MATVKVKLEADTWTEITAANCDFQNTSRKNVLVRESATIPTTATVDSKIAVRFTMYVFEPASGGALYAYCKGNIGSISYELT